LPTGDPVGGIYHFALIQQVLALFEKRGLKPVVQEIFAAANRDSKRPGVTILPQSLALFETMFEQISNNK
jgi:acetolactate synthase regulatory subunit